MEDFNGLSNQGSKAHSWQPQLPHENANTYSNRVWEDAPSIAEEKAWEQKLESKEKK